MAIPALNRSASMATQVLFGGRVVDSVTGLAPVSAVNLTLRYRNPDRPLDYSLGCKQMPDASFAYFGDPLRVFTDKSKVYALRLQAKADGYSAVGIDLDVGPLAGQPQAVMFSPDVLAQRPLGVRLYRGGGLPQRDLTLTLVRTAVVLRGVVVDGTQPARRIGSVSVTLHDRFLLPGVSAVGALPGSVTTNGQGEFVFPAPLPFVLAIVLKIEAQEYQTLTYAHMIDYAREINNVELKLLPVIKA